LALIRRRSSPARWTLRTLKLVALRGDLMEQAYPHGYGLTAIMGLTLPQVETLIEGTGTYIANLNAETQIVIAGTDEGMAQARARAGERGEQGQTAGGQRAVALRTAGKTGAKAGGGV
jgi:malonyl CoA-acyl carrier protein transacylase